MRIAFLEREPRFVGGSERMSLAVCRHAVARGHRAWLLHAEDGDMIAAYRDAGAEPQRLPLYPMAVRRPFEAWRSFRSLTSFIRRERIEVLFTSLVSYASLMAAAARRTRVRTVMHLGLIYDFPSPLFRAGMRGIDLAVAPSSRTAEGWRSRDWPAHALRVIPNGVDTTTFTPVDARDRERARVRVGLPLEAPLVAYVGRLVAEKGIFTLLRAFAAYQRAGGPGSLVLVGAAPGEEVQQLRSLAAELGCERWDVRPATDHPEDIYRAADLVVVPSEWDEPFGLVPLEAAACGTPVVVSDRGLLASLVAPVGETAVFPSGNVDRLSDRLGYWLTDERRRRAAGAALSSYARTNFSLERCGDAYLNEFKTLLAR